MPPTDLSVTIDLDTPIPIPPPLFFATTDPAEFNDAFWSQIVIPLVTALRQLEAPRAAASATLGRSPHADDAVALRRLLAEKLALQWMTGLAPLTPGTLLVLEYLLDLIAADAADQRRAARAALEEREAERREAMQHEADRQEALRLRAEQAERDEFARHLAAAGEAERQQLLALQAAREQAERQRWAAWEAERVNFERWQQRQGDGPPTAA